MKKPTLTPRLYPAIPGTSRRAAARQRALQQAPQRPEAAAEPARYDIMRAPAWTQGMTPAARAGADDHKQIASLGLGC